MNKTVAIWVGVVLVIAVIVLGVVSYYNSRPISTTDNVQTSTSTADLIRVDSPLPNVLVTSPLVVKGSARGNWYFEGSFPVKIVDGNGKQIAEAPAQAQGEWMTTDFVPFQVTLNFSKPTTSSGKIILQKDNPSGLPQNDNSIEIPIYFSDNPSKL